MKSANLPGSLFEDNGAIFSDNRTHRFALWRIWDPKKPLVMFIGLNPSTANESGDDPTIRRVKRFAYDWGFGGVYMMNLFSFVTAYPQDLIRETDFELTNRYLLLAHSRCKKVIFAWGNFKVYGRDKDMMDLFPNAEALAVNKNGSPKHPLYVKADIQPVKLIMSYDSIRPIIKSG